MSIRTRVAYDKSHLLSWDLFAVPYAQIFTGAEQCSPAQPISCESCCVDFWFQNTVLQQKRNSALAVDYTRLGIDLLLKKYSFHRVKEARLQYQGCDCNSWACNLIFKIFKLGKFEAQEIVLLMLCETQRDRLASDFNCSKLFGTVKKPL